MFWSRCVFARETKPASTLSVVRAEVRFVLPFFVLIRLTRSAGTVCLGRNLITVFSTVNNPPPNFSARRGAARLRANRGEPPWKRDTDDSCGCVVVTTKEKCLVFGTLRNRCVDARVSTRSLAAACALRCGRAAGAVRRPNFFSRAGLFFASHKPNCARTRGRSGDCNRGAPTRRRPDRQRAPPPGNRVAEKKTGRRGRPVCLRRRDAADFSARLLPAARRSRPGRAVPSAGRAPRLRARRSSRRRRRPR